MSCLQWNLEVGCVFGGVVLIWVLSWILCLTVNNAHIFKQCFYKTRRQHLCLFIQLWIFYSWCHYLIFPFCMQSLVLCFCYMQDSGSCKEGHRWDAQGAWSKSVNNSSTGPNSVPFPFLLFYTWWFLRKGNFSINMNYWFFLFSICLFCTNAFVLYLDSRHQQKVILEYTIFLHFKCSKP
jgi:hypothetical protein